MTTITLIGAGSAEFAAELVTDFLSVDALPEGEFRLVDIDAGAARIWPVGSPST